MIAETAEEVKEEEVEPQLLINGWEAQLKGRIKSSSYKDVDPRTAAHELYGYIAAQKAREGRQKPLLPGP